MNRIQLLIDAWKRQRAEAKAARLRYRRAESAARTITHELGRLGFKKELKDGTRRVVQWRYPLLLTPEEIWLRLDQARFPDGKSTNDLRHPDVIKSLCDRCGSDVRVDELPTKELAVVVRLAGNTFPAVFPINTFEMPSDAPPLAFPLGLDAKGVHRWADLTRLPHLLVVGPTGKGKSTLVHGMLTTWISRNNYDDIELWLADHKGGVELERYRSLLPTKNRPGIVRRFSYKPADTIALLENGLKELERRLDVLRNAGAVDVDDYARTTGQRMRRIVIMIDEIFFLMLNKEKIDPAIGTAGKGFTISAWAEQLFSKIASAGRAPGVHLVIATQKTGKDVLTSLITANFETRAVFGVADMYQSVYLVGNASAQNLPKGRVLFKHEGGELDEIQTPLITSAQAKLIISRIARYGPDGGLGAADEARRFRDDAKLLVTVACDQFDGRFTIRDLFGAESVRGVLTRERIEEIGKRLERDGVLTLGPRKSRLVAAGFRNRAGLLDSIYGLDSRPESLTEGHENAPDSEQKDDNKTNDRRLTEGQQEAQNPLTGHDQPLTDDRKKTGTMSDEPANPVGAVGDVAPIGASEPEPAAPAWFMKTFEPASQQAAPARALRPRAVITPARAKRRKS